MNNKFLIQFILGITIIGFLFWVYCDIYLENPGYLFNSIFNATTFVNSYLTLNTDVNLTNVVGLKVNNVQLPPHSLWHNKNGQGGFGNGRILSQRKWTDELSKSSAQIPKKNILVIKDVDFNLATALGSHQLCPIKFENNISNICNFVIVNISQLQSVNIFKYAAVISAVNGIEHLEKEIWNPKRINMGLTAPPPIHIYFSQESPISPYVPSVNLFLNNKILASYWSNADIPVPYGLWLENTNISRYTLPQNSTYDDKKNYAQGKTKLVAMLISNCQGRNDRMKYALELRNYLDVDIYGKCSPEKKSCDPNCFKMLKENYKFYLAFENANCRDYITEKLYRNAFQNDVVPIVMGAHPEDYKAVAPPNSYIHVEDFTSPEALAEYLIKVHENDQLYNNYFKWKKSGQFVVANEDFFCRACGMMIYSDVRPKPAWSTNSTYKSENKCLQDKNWYWTG